MDQALDVDLITRWNRIRKEICFADVVADIHGTTQDVIPCPFHGQTSRPSFTLYRRTNDGYCFSCPEGRRYYDAVLFVCEEWGYTRLQAITWLEQTYNISGPVPVETTQPFSWVAAQQSTSQWKYDSQDSHQPSGPEIPAIDERLSDYAISTEDVHSYLYDKLAAKLTPLAITDPERMRRGNQYWAILQRKDQREMLRCLTVADLSAISLAKYRPVEPGDDPILSVADMQRMANPGHPIERPEPAAN